MISRKQKIEVTKQIGDKLSKYNVVAVASIAGLKSRQFNAIKKKSIRISNSPRY